MMPGFCGDGRNRVTVSIVFGRPVSSSSFALLGWAYSGWENWGELLKNASGGVLLASAFSCRM